VEVKSTKDPVDEIDEALREDIYTLVHQGYLTDNVVFGGHSFDIRTLNAREGWAALTAINQYKGSLAESRAYMAAVVGLSLLAYDGEADFHLKLDNLEQHALKRLNFVGQWDDVVIEHIFAAYNLLDARRVRARIGRGFAGVRTGCGRSGDTSGLRTSPR
jgi:hypothetical protein